MLVNQGQWWIMGEWVDWRLSTDRVRCLIFLMIRSFRLHLEIVHSEIKMILVMKVVLLEVIIVVALWDIRKRITRLPVLLVKIVRIAISMMHRVMPIVLQSRRKWERFSRSNWIGCPFRWSRPMKRKRRIMIHYKVINNFRTLDLIMDLFNHYTTLNLY